MCIVYKKNLTTKQYANEIDFLRCVTSHEETHKLKKKMRFEMRFFKYTLI